MQRGEESRPGGGSEEAAATLKACSSVSSLFLLFYICVCFLVFSFLYVFVTLSLWFLHFLFPCFADFIYRKMKAKTEKESLLVYGFFFFSRFSCSFFSSFFFVVCLPKLTSTQWWRKETLCSLCFFLSLLTACLSCVFSCLSFFVFSPFFFFLTRRGLYSLTCISI